MADSGERSNVVIAAIEAIDKKLDLLIGMVQSLAKRQTHLETRMAAYDGRSEPDFGNGAADEDGE